jgi:murein DD-endopeptidase MepM/ murein hydrolase activator NlpD
MTRLAVTGLLTLGLALAQPSIELSVQSRTLGPGELVVLSITLTAPVEHLRVRAFDRDVPAFREGEGVWRALVGVDLGVRPGTYTIAVAAGPANASYDLIVKPRTFRTRRLTVNEAFVTPPPSEQARITEEAALLATVWRSGAGERLWTGGFVRPVPGAANSAFGTRSIYNGKPRTPHGGADFLSPGGTPVRAPNAGRIAVARALYFTGNTVVIDHGLGLFSTLAHLSAIDVQEGNRVAAGDVIGQVGATGRVTGPHLHWAVRANDARVDPLSLLALLGAPEPQP